MNNDMKGYRPSCAVSRFLLPSKSCRRPKLSLLQKSTTLPYPASVWLVPQDQVPWATSQTHGAKKRSQNTIRRDSLLLEVFKRSSHASTCTGARHGDTACSISVARHPPPTRVLVLVPVVPRATSCPCSAHELILRLTLLRTEEKTNKCVNVVQTRNQDQSRCACDDRA